MGQILDELCAKAAGRRVPLTVQVDLTWRCNAQCVHCYLPDHAAEGATTEQVAGLLEQLAAAGTLFLVLSGGEVLLRPDLFDILERARSLSFAVVLKTNGTLIDQQAAERLAALGLLRVDISLYSHRGEVHDAISRLPGSWRRSVEAIRRLVSAGVRVRVVNVLMKTNAGDAAAVRELADSLGASYTIDPTVTPRLDGDGAVTRLGLDPEQLETALSDPFLAGALSTLCEMQDVPANTADEQLCSAGHFSCYVSPAGDMFPCVQLPLPCGNVYQGGFGRAWRSQQMEMIRSMRVGDLKDCGGCPLVAICTRCPGLALMEGNLAGKSTLDCLKATVVASVVSRARQRAD
jgi:radical SAM protein with 4Fe4S-binding SPASM domain